MFAGRLLIKRFIIFLIVSLTFYFLGSEFSSNWEALKRTDFAFSWKWAIVAVTSFIFGQFILNLQWTLIINDLSAPKNISLIQSTGVLNITQLAKYLPGRVWGYGLQALWLKKAGFSASKVAFAGFVQQVFAILIAFSVGTSIAYLYIPSLPSWATATLALCFWAATLIFGFGYNFMIKVAANLFMRIFSIQQEVYRLRNSTLFIFAFLYILFLIVFSIALFSVASCIGIQLSRTDLAALLGAVLISDVIGLLALVVPGGIGVRESGIYYLMTPILGVSHALVFPLISRAFYIATDLILCCFSFACLRVSPLSTDKIDEKENHAEPIKPVLLVLSSGYPKFTGDVRGGAPFVHELARRLVNEYEVHVITPYCHGSETSSVLDGVFVRRFRYLPPGIADLTGEGGISDNLKASYLNFFKVPLLLLSMIVMVIRYLIRFRARPLIIHAHWIIPQGLVAVIAKLLLPWPVTVVSTAHGSDIMSFSSGIFGQIQRFILKRSDAVTVVSQALADILQDRFATKDILVAPMGVDTSLFHPEKASTELKNSFSPNGPFLLFVGFLVDVKGVDILLEAFAEVLTIHPAAKLIIVGDGQERAKLEAYALSLGLKKNVKFLGALQQDEIAPLLATADVFVAPSRREGFGLVFAEAMSSGALVVAPDIQPINLMVKHGENGFLAKAECSRSFAENILNVLAQHGVSSHIRSNARRDILNLLGWNRVSENYKKLLGDLTP